MSIPRFQGAITQSSYEDLDLIRFEKFSDVKVYAHTLLVDKLTFFQKVINQLNDFFADKKFVKLTIGDSDLLVKINDIALELDISSEAILEADKAGSLEKLINLAIEAKHYNVDFSVFNDTENLSELEYLGVLADTLHVTLRSLLEAKKLGNLETFIEEAKEVEEKVQATFLKLDKLYLNTKFTSKKAELGHHGLISGVSEKELESIKSTIRSAYKVIVKDARNPKENEDLEVVVPIHKNHSVLVKTSKDSMSIIGFFGKEVGRGAFGVALQGLNLLEGALDEGENAVIKIPVDNPFEKPNTTPISEKFITQEVEILKTIHQEKVVLGIQKPLKEFKNIYRTGAKNVHVGGLYNTDLRKFLNSKSNFSNFEKSSAAYQLLFGVNHLHSQGITHGDIKPENIFFNYDKNINRDETKSLVFLGDFGDAFQHDIVHLDGPFERVFTPLYKAASDIKLISELIIEKNYTNYRDIEEKADIYALSSTICSLFIQELPYSRRKRDEDAVLIEDLKEKLMTSGVSSEFADLLIQGLNNDYTLRPAISDLMEAARKDMEALDQDKAAIIESI